jgi:hypothetical protein
MEPLLGSTPLTAGDLRTTPFAHVLVELLETEESGTLFIHAEGDDAPIEQTLEAAVRIESGWPAAVRFEDETGRTSSVGGSLLQALIPLCSRNAGAFRFVAGQHIEMDEARSPRSRLDPLALIMAASRGPLREDAVEQVMSSVARHLVKLNPRANIERYALTAQERAIVDCLAQGPIDLPQLRAQNDAPERIVRRVLYVLRITHALTVMPLVRRTQSGTVAHAAPLPERRSTNPSLPARPISAPAVEAPYEPPNPTVVFETPKLRPGSSGRFKAVTTPPASPIGGSLPPRAKKNMPATRSLLEAGAGRYSMSTPENATTSAYQRGSQPPDGKSIKPERPDPEACFARAERLMKQREYAAALQASNEALRLGGDRAEHEALYAWLLCLQGSDTELRVHPRAMQHLDRALRRDPLCERANHYKGMVLKRLGRFDEAHNYFLRAMQVNRDNLEAAREVRLYDMRKRNRDSRPSLVNKLLKKFGDDE